MTDWKRRLESERLEVARKLEEMTTGIGEAEFDAISDDAKSIMLLQFAALIDYAAQISSLCNKAAKVTT
jgi:hypothetical protein